MTINDRPTADLEGLRTVEEDIADAMLETLHHARHGETSPKNPQREQEMDNRQ